MGLILFCQIFCIVSLFQNIDKCYFSDNAFELLLTCAFYYYIIIEVRTPNMPIGCIEICLFPVTYIVDTFNVMVNDITRVMYNIGPFIVIITGPSKIFQMVQRVCSQKVSAYLKYLSNYLSALSKIITFYIAFKNKQPYITEPSAYLKYLYN